MGTNFYLTLHDGTDGTERTRVHIGKRSFGWSFVYNFHNTKYFHNLVTLIWFLMSGTISDEYGVQWNFNEFITMALNWHPKITDGIRPSFDSVVRGRIVCGAYDSIIDGLRVSQSTDFC